jgi:serine/threonine-protein kinase
MQLIEGQTLAAVIRDARQPEGEPTAAAGAEAAASTAPAAALSTARPRRDAASYRRVAEVGAQAAEALDYAHQMGVIHRDVKPSNLLLDGRGQLWVTDFGLAQLQTSEGPTLTGDLLGTLRYMSPEQALAQRVLVDQRTDVYSLGATLYELLTLRPVFLGEDRQELLRQIAFDEPTPPRRLNRVIPAELETVVLKALEKRPQDRYATAQELAEDLRRFLEDKPIRARRPSWRQVALKWTRRHRPAVWAAAVTVILTLAVLGGSVGWVLRDRAARQAEAESPVAATVEEAERLLGQHKVRAALSAAERADGLLVQVGGHPLLSPQVRQLVKDLRMRVTLEEIRLTQAAVKDGHFDLAGADPLFALAFRNYGIDVDALPPAEAAARVRASRMAADLVAALDAWSLARKDSGQGERESWRWLLAVAREADPDAWRDRLRDVLEGKGKGTLAVLGELEKASALPASTLALVVWAVKKQKDRLAQVVPLLRRAQQRQPDDFWVNHNLAFALYRMTPPQLDEAIGFYRAAVAICPDSPGTRVNLGIALRAQGRLDEAIGEYRAAIALDPEDALPHNGLGNALWDKGRPDEAIKEYRAAIALNARYAVPHNGLGNALRAQGRLDKAIGEYRAAIALDPEDALPHNGLGNALRKKGRLDDAMKEYRAAIALDPKSALPHDSLGLALRAKGRLDEAIGEFRAAIALDPKDAKTHTNLGHALHDKGQLDGAIGEFRAAIALDPKLALPYYNLGNALRDKKRLDEAMKAYRTAIALDPKLAEPHDSLGNALRDRGRLTEAVAAYREAIRLRADYPEAHCSLGLILLRQRQFVEALAALKRGHELGVKQTGWRYPSADWVRNAERLVLQEVKLPAFRKGEYQPQDNTERLALVDACRAKTLFLTAARLCADAFAADPKLAADLKAGHRYNAARYAALAAAGEGNDAAQLGKMEHARWRQQAVDWLRADLKLWVARLNGDKAADRAAVRKMLRHWQEDTDLAGLRDPEALTNLPPPEQESCRHLWAGVANTLAAADGKTAPAKESDVK